MLCGYIRFSNIKYNNEIDDITRRERLYFEHSTPSKSWQHWVKPEYKNIDASIELNQVFCVFSNGITI